MLSFGKGKTNIFDLFISSQLLTKKQKQTNKNQLLYVFVRSLAQLREATVGKFSNQVIEWRK